jgi:geranylgeranyl diphosphate synthase type II
LGGGTAREVHALQGYGEKMGLAFQVVDDLLDLQGEPRKLGKAARKDQSRGKLTYPSLYGIAESRRQAECLMQEAVSCLSALDRRATPLREIAKYIVRRAH